MTGAAGGSVRRTYRLHWTPQSTLRIEAAAALPNGVLAHVGRLDLGNGLQVGVDPRDRAAPEWVEIDDGEAARVGLQDIFGWDSWPTLWTALEGAGDLGDIVGEPSEGGVLADLDVRESFTALAMAAVVAWVARWSPLPLREELLDFELGAQLAAACDGHAPLLRAHRLLAGVAEDLPLLARGFAAWGPDVAPLLETARDVLRGSGQVSYVEETLRRLQVPASGEAVRRLDEEWLSQAPSLGTVRAGRPSDAGAALLHPVDWERLPPRVVSALTETPVRLRLDRGSVTVDALLDGGLNVVTPRSDLRFQIYRNGIAEPGLQGALYLNRGTGHYEGTVAPTDPLGSRWLVDVAVPGAVAAVQVDGAVASRAAAWRWAVRAVTAERVSTDIPRSAVFGAEYPDPADLWRLGRAELAGAAALPRPAVPAPLTLAELEWLARW